MFFHFLVFFYSLAYLAGLEAMVYWNDGAVSIAVALLVFTFIVSRRLGRGFAMAIIPLFFTLSSIILLYLIDSTAQRHIFAFLSFTAYYLALFGVYRLRYYERDKTARGILAFSGMATFSLFYSGVYGLYLNFAVPIWGLMLTYCFGTTLIGYPYLRLLKQSDPRVARMYSLLLGLCMAEVAWIISFWPFGYLTTGVIALIFYFTLWDLVQSYFLSIFSKKRVLVHLVLFCFLIGMVLVSARWLPVV